MTRTDFEVNVISEFVTNDKLQGRIHDLFWVTLPPSSWKFRLTLFKGKGKFARVLN
jgi:hypothetical protein